MDISKLRIDSFKKIAYVNFEDKLCDEFDEYEVIIYKINVLEDIPAFVDYVNARKMSVENRLVMVYEKGGKTVNKNSIIKPFKENIYLDFVLKAPMLCSLDKKLSAFVLKKENTC
ncbi:hypothetical protein EZV73_10290 [Acidaminobacter sp. JC074]|uniref:hypothetical protein n=1 Tax=Acidaminobacter sp. JC074 TaxID=2530199 RepID=UPI001F10EDC5|nr:hypothetical protein [Acidaminobacter sp. JC074]MCH4887964.1 hypothetical protein [Acidaminobacter sp. JC074]